MCLSVSEVWLSHLRSVLWSSGRRRGDRPCAVRPRGAVLCYAHRHAPVLISGLGKVGKSFGRVFQRKEGGEEPEDVPGSSTTSGAPPGGRRRRRPARRGRPSFPYTGWHWSPPFCGGFSPTSGERGDSHVFHELRGARPARAARNGAPPSGCGAPRSTPTRWWKSAFTAPENFKGGRGGPAQGPPGTPFLPGPPTRAPGPTCRIPEPALGHLSGPRAARRRPLTSVTEAVTMHHQYLTLSGGRRGTRLGVP